MADTKISALTAVTSPTKTDELAVNQSSASKKITLAQIAQFDAAQHMIRQATTYTLTSTTSQQKLFNSVTNGTLTLSTGTYLFDAIISLSSMSTTSGNGAFSAKGAGTAVLDDVLYHTVGIDGATATAAAQAGSTTVATTGTSAASVVTAGTGTALQMNIRGTFEVTTGGTIIPSISLVTAAAAIVAAGSYFRCQRVGDINMVSQGDWS